MSKSAKSKRDSQDDYNLYEEGSKRKSSDERVKGYDTTEKRTSACSGKAIAALITAVGVIIAAYVTAVLPQKQSIRATQTAESRQIPATSPGATAEIPAIPPTALIAQQARTGRLEGTVTDRKGNPISDLLVSILNGPAAETDMQGIFVLNNVPEGDQLIVVKPPSGGGDVMLNVSVVSDQNNEINIVYDATTSRLGLLSITSPVDGGDLEIRKSVDSNNDTIHRATIFGRCDGLGQIFQNGFNVWVLVSSERDGKFWVQFPSATIDPHNNTWRATVLLGNAQHPPSDGELWTMVAVAADSDSELGRILNTPELSLLPPHITSNVVSIESQASLIK